MNKWYVLSLALLTIGVVFLVQGFLDGDIEVGIVFIVPFLRGSGLFAGVAFLSIAGSVVCLFLGMMYPIQKQDSAVVTHEEQKSSIKTGGVIFIGPIPVVFASNWKIAMVIMILAIILIVATSILILNL